MRKSKLFFLIKFLYDKTKIAHHENTLIVLALAIPFIFSFNIYLSKEVAAFYHIHFVSNDRKELEITKQILSNPTTIKNI